MTTRGDVIDELRAADPAQGLSDRPLDGRASSDLQRAVTGDPQRNQSVYRGSRWRVPVIAATATLLAVAAVPVVRALDGNDAGPQKRPDGTWTYSFEVALPPGWKVFNRNIDSIAQSLAVLGPKDEQCYITEFRKGTFGRDRLFKATPVRVGDHPGFAARVRDVGILAFKALGQPLYLRPTGPVVAWEHAPGSWRLDYCVSNPGASRPDPAKDLADGLLIARAVKDVRQPVRTPYKVGYLPDGWKARTIGEPGNSDRDPLGARSVLTIAPPGADNTRPLSTDPDIRAFRHINISMTVPSVVSGGGSPSTVNGPQTRLSRYSLPGSGLTTYWLVMKYEHFSVVVEVTTTSKDFDDEVRRIGRELTMAPDPLDSSTWFDADTAFPK